MAPSKARLALVFATLLVGLGPASAEQPQSGPAVAAQGFRYQQIQRPGSDVVTHVSECEEPACGPGSKVSYIVVKAQPHSLEAYKSARDQMAAYMRREAPEGMTFEFDAPTLHTIGDVTVYEARRVQTSADGSRVVVVSKSMFYGDNQVDLVSSSSFPKVAEGNARVFEALILAAMALRNGR